MPEVGPTTGTPPYPTNSWFQYLREGNGVISVVNLAAEAAATEAGGGAGAALTTAPPSGIVGAVELASPTSSDDSYAGIFWSTGESGSLTDGMFGGVSLGWTCAVLPGEEPRCARFHALAPGCLRWPTLCRRVVRPAGQVQRHLRLGHHSLCLHLFQDQHGGGGPHAAPEAVQPWPWPVHLCQLGPRMEPAQHPQCVECSAGNRSCWLQPD